MKTRRNKRKMKIAAVVVTYNRLQLLKQCIASIKRQTRKPDAIYVINNGSTDGTLKWLKKQSEMITITQGNIGGAGGFHRGIKEVYQAGYDWFWIMDDDVVFEITTLEEMMKYMAISKFIHVSRLDNKGNRIFWEYEFDENKLKGIKVKHPERDKYYYTNISCFEGALIHRSVVRKHGLPDERFFVCGDDTMYGYFASKTDDIICIKQPMIRKIIDTTIESPTSVYFRIRNIMLRHQSLKEHGIDISLWLAYRSLFGTAAIAIIKQLVLMRVSPRYIEKVILGIHDGLKGYYGVPKWMN